jgi:hypothetical protein
LVLLLREEEKVIVLNIKHFPSFSRRDGLAKRGWGSYLGFSNVKILSLNSDYTSNS